MVVVFQWFDVLLLGKSTRQFVQKCPNQEHSMNQAWPHSEGEMNRCHHPSQVTVSQTLLLTAKSFLLSCPSSLTVNGLQFCTQEILSVFRDDAKTRLWAHFLGMTLIDNYVYVKKLLPVQVDQAGSYTKLITAD